jgi:signal transduction histidine kinase
MHNIVKHAQACSVLISIDTVEDSIRASVADDGVGFDVQEVSSRPDHAHGFGLFNVRERLHHLGGRLEVKSTPGRGTCVTVIAPIKQV